MLIISDKFLNVYAQLVSLMINASKDFIFVNDALDFQLVKIDHVEVSDFISYFVRRFLHKKHKE